MVKVYLLPADEGDFIWVRYSNDGNYANILIETNIFQYKQRDS